MHNFATLKKYEIFYIYVNMLNMLIAQSCPTLCDPMVSSVHRMFQERILEWVATVSSRVSSQPGIELVVSPASSTSQADSLLLNHSGKPSNRYPNANSSQVFFFHGVFWLLTVALGNTCGLKQEGEFQTSLGEIIWDKIELSNTSLCGFNHLALKGLMILLSKVKVLFTPFMYLTITI